MPHRSIKIFLPSVFCVLALHGILAAQGNDLKIIQAVGTEGDGHQQAIVAVKRVSQLPSDQVINVLKAIGDATPIGRNWLRVVAADVADNGDLDVGGLQAFISDRSQSREARFAAYQLLIQENEQTATSMLGGMLDDPSLNLRYAAINQLLDQAGKVDESSKQDLYERALKLARHPGQLTKIAKSLRDLGQEVDLASIMGFVTGWKLVAPFDNTDVKGFDIAYPPESDYLESAGYLPSKSSYEGKKSKVSWQTHQTDDELGMVNLNRLYDNEKSAICYGCVNVESRVAGPAQVRLGCIVANKIWVNGKLVMANEVYHARTGVDQYVDDFELLQGSNKILIKICQNDQPQSWAQDWEFQLRITDPDGNPLDLVVINEE